MTPTYVGTAKGVAPPSPHHWNLAPAWAVDIKGALGNPPYMIMSDSIHVTDIKCPNSGAGGLQIGVIGAIVGGAVGFVALLGLLFGLYKRKKKQQELLSSIQEEAQERASSNQR